MADETMDRHHVTHSRQLPKSIRSFILSCCTNSHKQPTRYYLMYYWYTRKNESVNTLPPGISLIRVYARKVGQLNFMVACPDGFVYTGCDSTFIHVWNNAKAVCSVDTKKGPVQAAVVGPQGRIISSHHDGTINVWKRTDKTSSSYKYKKIVTIPIQVDRLISKLHCLNSDSWRFNLNSHDAMISCLCLSEDNKFLYSGSLDHTIKVWRLRDWRLVETIQGDTHKVYFDKRCAGKVNAIATGSGDLMFSCSNDGSVVMFRRVEQLKRKDIPKHQRVCSLFYGEVEVNALLFRYSKDGTSQLFAGFADGTLRFWQQSTDWKQTMTLSYHKKAVTCMAGLSGSLVFSGSLDGVICAWKTEKYNARPLIVLTPSQGSVHCLAVREDWEDNANGPRRLILYSNGEDGTIKIWRIASEEGN